MSPPILHFAVTVALIGFGESLLAQTPDTTAATLTLSAYVDGYYAAYSNDRPASELQPFTTVGARNKSIGLNVAQVGVKYAAERVRANVVLHYGDIMKATWSQDFQAVQRANAGVRLAPKLWLDAGFFATHIGSESFLPKNNMLSQTAVLTFNEPFYQAGAKLSYAATERLSLELWVLNGYNRFVDNNSAKSLGLLAVFEVNDGLALGFSNVFGRESADGAAVKQFRYYQNAYVDYRFGKWRSLTGVDYGAQTNSDLAGEGRTAQLVSGHTTLRRAFAKTFGATARVETYQDKQGFISGALDRRSVDPQVSLASEGLRWTAYALGGEWAPTEGAYLRFEARHVQLASVYDVFNTGGRTDRYRRELLVTVGVAMQGGQVFLD